MIDLDRETPVTLAEAPRLIPAINAIPGMEPRKSLHPRTIYNWATRGKRGVVLETMPVGGILVTSREAITRFFVRLNMAREQRRIDHEQDHQTIHRSRVRSDYAKVRERLARDHGI